MIHAVNYSNSYKYFHFHLNTFSHYLFLLPTIEVHFNPILKFMIEYTFQPQLTFTFHKLYISPERNTVFWK